MASEYSHIEEISNRDKRYKDMFNEMDINIINELKPRRARPSTTHWPVQTTNAQSLPPSSKSDQHHHHDMHNNINKTAQSVYLTQA